jgi:hypothetical protein
MSTEEHNDIVRVENPFGERGAGTGLATSVGAASMMAAEIAEIKGAMMLARTFPRDMRIVADKVLTDCTRVSLAESAEYAYKRGKEIVSGPSIRLAECLALHFGNIRTGWRVLHQGDDQSEVEAYCWDLETNRKASRQFTVPHLRHSREHGTKKLTDSRDIYELQANMAARRLRACILECIPGDLVESAVRQTQVTLNSQHGAPAERIAKMVAKFETLGVTTEMLNRRLGHPVDACKDAEVLNLFRIFNSIRDGIGKVSDYFETGDREAPSNAELTEQLRTRAAGQNTTKTKESAE